jgi:hypothetical protein
MNHPGAQDLQADLQLPSLEKNNPVLQPGFLLSGCRIAKTQA